MALTDVKSEQIQSSVALAGSPTTTTQSASDNSTKIATTAYVETAVANLVASAPSALNTLDELAAALNDDASFSTTVTNSIATKLPLAGGTLTGALVGTTATFAGGAANNNDDANILTLNASQHARLLVDTSSTSGHRATLALESNGNELTLGTTGSASYLTSVGNLEITGGNVGINYSTPKEKLHVVGAAVFDGNHATATNAFRADEGVLIHGAGNVGYVTAVSNGNNNIGLQLRALNSGSANSEQLVLNSNGLVGIGKTPAFASLEIEGDKTLANNLQLALNGATNTNKQLIIGFDTSTDESHIISQIAGSALKPLILSASAVGVGASSMTPTSALHVDKSHVGSALVTFHQTAGNSSADRGLDVETSSTGTTVQRWLNSGVELARISGTGVFSLYSQRLEISNSGDTKATFIRSNNTVSLAMATTASGGYGFYDNSRGGYDLYMKNGQVGIGTSNPTRKLHLVSTGSATYSGTGAGSNIALHLANLESGAAGRTIGIGMSSESNAEVYLNCVTAPSNNGGDFVIASRNAGARSEKMRVHAEGQVTMPSQTYVQGRGNAGWSAYASGWNIEPHAANPTLSINRGNTYNTTNKRFTAPVEGVYLVCASWYIYHPAASSRGSQYVHPAIYVNGSLNWNSGTQPYTIYGHNESDSNTTHFDGIQLTHTVHLAANDYVDLRMYSNSTSTQSYENYYYFSYTLLN